MFGVIEGGIDMRIKNRKKLITRTSMLIAIILFFILFTSKSFSKVEYELKTIYISYGDTLWSIAIEEQENNSYYYGKSIKYVLEDIIKLNNLKNSYIYEGQKIKIPTLI